ncbi:MAG: LL-diaminopimelate aminotransferase [Oscillatoriales cyanobacterium SM2_1_8]|nr:LL-diaminopimelate aminotransferase [Oscillatoriales cyanobacterium SM2_1_8]
MRLATRLQGLQANVFADMDRAKQEAIAAGLPLWDLSLGSSDLPVAPHIVAAIQDSLQDSHSFGYTLFGATADLRRAIAQWLVVKFGVEVDPETEVLPLIGSQEGTGHLPLAVLNPGDMALLQNPGYPSHYGGVALAGGVPYGMELRPETGFLPQFDRIPGDVLARTRLMVLSYPHNPTTAIAPREFWEEALAFARRHDLVLAHDFPYVDFALDGSLPPSVLQVDRGRERSLEFFSLSKSYHMGGLRVGFAVGNRELIGALRRIKAVVDFNQYRGILRGAIAALTGPQDGLGHTQQILRERRDAAVQAFRAIGWTVPVPAATMYLWAPLPGGGNSLRFCQELVKNTGVALAPGSGFGSAGEGTCVWPWCSLRRFCRRRSRRSANFSDKLRSIAVLHSDETRQVGLQGRSPRIGSIRLSLGRKTVSF